MAYPESLQKVLPHPQSAPQGGLWPILISWREARASGLSTADPGSAHPRDLHACPGEGGRCLGTELGGLPRGDYVGSGGGHSGSSVSHEGLSYSWKGAGSCRVTISPGAQAPCCSCAFARKSLGLHRTRREEGGPHRIRDGAESPASCHLEPPRSPKRPGGWRGPRSLRERLLQRPGDHASGGP